MPVESGRRVDARELLEDALALLRRDAGPVIGDAHLTPGRVRTHASGRHEDLRAGRREPQRVLEQVAEDLLHHLDVDLDVAERRRDVEPDAVGAARAAAAAAPRAWTRSRDVDRLAVHVERTGADPAELEDVGDEPFEAFGLVVDRVEQLGAVVGVELEIGRAQGRRRRLDRRQRCAQVVGDRGEEARAGAADLRREARLVAPRPPVAAGRSRRRAPRPALRAAARSAAPAGARGSRSPPPRAARCAPR